jgi:hypothetical protein
LGNLAAAEQAVLGNLHGFFAFIYTVAKSIPHLDRFYVVVGFAFLAAAPG